MEFDPSKIDVATGMVWFLAFLFSTTVHEAMHAFAAWRLGDDTAYRGGQVCMSIRRQHADASVDTQNRPLMDT